MWIKVQLHAFLIMLIHVGEGSDSLPTYFTAAPSSWVGFENGLATMVYRKKLVLCLEYDLFPQLSSLQPSHYTD